MTQDPRSADQDHLRALSRRGFLRSALLLSGVAIGGSLLAACSSAAPPAPAPALTPAAASTPAANRLVYANPSKLRTLDTISVYGLQEFQIGRQMMEPLLDLTQDGKLTPVLAESWAPSADGK